MARAAELTRDQGAAPGNTAAGDMATRDAAVPDPGPHEPAGQRLRPGKTARAVVADGRAVHDAIEAVLAAPGEAREVARQAYEAVRGQLVKESLDAMPVDRLRDAIGKKVSFAPFIDAGLTTVGQLLDTSPEALRKVPGVRRRNARRIMAAAVQARADVAQAVRVRLDPDARTPEQTALIAALRRFERSRSALKGPDLGPLADEISKRLDPAARAASRARMLFTFGAEKKQEARDALEQLGAILDSKQVTTARKRLDRAQAELDKKDQRATRLWNDFLARPVTYNGLLIEVAELSPEKDASQGFLPSDIAEHVRVFPLDQSLLKTPLRGYQAFGAKFALVQERVILGDEMGLGKTIQSLAVMCHLAAKGATHFLVVCPASVVINWTREIERHTQLRPRRLHLPGNKRNVATQEWLAEGGVAVTTFEALRAMPQDMDVSVALLVVDEAHYAKNPAALRTQAVSEWAARSRRALFLTGTPMENKVAEFQVLVSHLRPEVAEDLDLSGAEEELDGTGFREKVAPVYLRRNQEDVLSELPGRLETQEWVPLDGQAARAYRAAVQDGNFMAMRRAAFEPATVKGSAKLRRLVELVDEAADGGRKVIVFSYFRSVLETVSQALQGRDGVAGVRVVGPLTGDISPADRQAMVDELTDAKGPAVLVAQIQAGGVGLNIQAASVIVLAEPQLTPSIEEQAIARAHRMGQVRPVDVHRLLCEDSVDQRVLELLAGKREAFDEYARRSDMAKAAPDAFDNRSEADLRAEILAVERKRLKAA